MPIHTSWKSMAKGMKTTYKAGKTKCRSFTDGTKVCMSAKAWQVFFATINKMGADETKPRPKSKKTQESVEKIRKWFMETKFAKGWSMPKGTTFTTMYKGQYIPVSKKGAVKQTGKTMAALMAEQKKFGYVKGLTPEYGPTKAPTKAKVPKAQKVTKPTVKAKAKVPAKAPVVAPKATAKKAMAPLKSITQPPKTMAPPQPQIGKAVSWTPTTQAPVTGPKVTKGVPKATKVGRAKITRKVTAVTLKKGKSQEGQIGRAWAGGYKRVSRAKIKKIVKWYTKKIRKKGKKKKKKKRR